MKKALPEVIDVLYEEAKQLYTSHDEATLKNYIARIDPDYRITTDDGVFERDDLGRYFLAGYPVVVPTDLLEAIRERIRLGVEYTHLIEYWKLLMINPESRVREELFQYCKGEDKGFEITTDGYLLGYVECRLNHNMREFERFLQEVYRSVKNRDKHVYFHTSNWRGKSYSLENIILGDDLKKMAYAGVVKHLYRDLFEDPFSKLKAAQNTVFRTLEDIRVQLQVGQACTQEMPIQHTMTNTGNINRIIVMVMINPANITRISSATDVYAMECYPYGAIQEDVDGNYHIIGESLMEVDYMKEDYYNMQSLLTEARDLVGSRTIQLSKEDIKRILDSRKIFVDKSKKE